MRKEARSTRILLYQSLGFLAIMSLSWFDELIGLRGLVLGNHPYISDFRESTLEMLTVLAVWLVVALSTHRVLSRTRHLESFMRVCAWCRRIEHCGRWMRIEEFLKMGFDTPTSHGICEECLEKERAALERAKATRHLPHAVADHLAL